MTRRRPTVLLCLPLLLSLHGCDEDPVADAGVDAALDAALDASSTDAGSDAGSDAGPGAPPGESIADGLCDSDGSLALAADGSRAAFVTCTGDAALWIVRLPAGSPVRVDDASAETRVRFSPDAAWLTWGDPTGWSIQGVDMTAAAVSVAAGTIDQLRFVIVDPTGTPRLRLLTLATDGSTRRVTMRNDGDLFFGSTTLIEDPDIASGLGLVSGSRGSLILETDDGTTRGYEIVATDGSGTPSTLPIDPSSFVLGPVGMGDTHGIFLGGAGLSFVEFATASGVMLETDGVSSTPSVVIEDSVDGKYAYYLRNGDPTRRLRNGSGPSQMLASADATTFWTTPNQRMLLYPSGGRLFSINIDGSGSTDLGPHTGASIDGANAPSSTEVGVIDGGAMVRFEYGTADSNTVLDDSGVVAGSAGYDGPGERLLWQRDADGTGRVDVLRAAGVGVDTTSTIAWDVDAWWAVPTRAQLLYRTTSGALHRL